MSEDENPDFGQRRARTVEEELEYREGDIYDLYDIGEEIASSENEGQGSVHRGTRKADGLNVVIKTYNDRSKATWEQLFDGEKRAGREKAFLTRANRDGVRGVPVAVHFGTTGSALKSPVIVMKALSGKTLEQEVMDNSYVPTIERTWEVMSALREPIEYAHKNNGVKPVIHRDINPGNVMVNGHENPAVLMDFGGSSNPSTGRTLIRTQMLTRNFSAPEVTEGKEIDVRADVYGLGVTAQYMLVGAQHFNLADGKLSEGDFQGMNIPREVISVLEKATKEEPNERYRNVAEFYDAFGKAVGRRSLPVQVNTREEKPEALVQNLNGIDFIDNGDSITFLYTNPEGIIVPSTEKKKTLARGKYPRGKGELSSDKIEFYGKYLLQKPNQVVPKQETRPATRTNGAEGLSEVKRQDGKLWIGDVPYDDNGSVYATAKSIMNVNQVFFHEESRPFGDYDTQRAVTLRERWRDLLVYLQDAAQEHPILQEVLDRKTTLEDVVREKGPNKEDFLTVGRTIPQAISENGERYKREKTEFDQRRKDLYGVLGVDEESQEAALGAGAALGLVGSVFGSDAVFNGFETIPRLIAIAASALGGTYLVAKGFEKIAYYTNQSTLLKQAREMDSWIREARRSEGSLEERAGESVGLSWKKKGGNAIVASCSGAVIGFLPSGIGGIAHLAINNPIIDQRDLLATMVVTGVASGVGLTSYFYRYFNSQDLKKKRLATGLPAEEEKPKMREYYELKIPPENEQRLLDFLSSKGFRKKGFPGNEFVGEGIGLRYLTDVRRGGAGYVSYGDDIKIMARSPEKAYNLVDELIKHKLIGESYRMILPGGSEE